MFQLNITKAPDEDLLGIRTYFQDSLVFGRDMGDYLSPDLDDHCLVLELITTENQLVGKGSLKKSFDNVSLNGKKIGLDFSFKEGDQLILGENQLTILKLSSSGLQTREQLVQAQVKTLKDDRHPAVEVIRLLEKKIGQE